jgi:hypothetical protein
VVILLVVTLIAVGAYRSRRKKREAEDDYGIEEDHDRPRDRSEDRGERYYPRSRDEDRGRRRNLLTDDGDDDLFEEMPMEEEVRERPAPPRRAERPDRFTPTAGRFKAVPPKDETWLEVPKERPAEKGPVKAKEPVPEVTRPPVPKAPGPVSPARPPPVQERPPAAVEPAPSPGPEPEPPKKEPKGEKDEIDDMISDLLSKI